MHKSIVGADAVRYIILKFKAKMPSIFVNLQSAMRNTENRGGLET